MKGLTDLNLLLMHAYSSGALDAMDKITAGEKPQIVEMVKEFHSSPELYRKVSNELYGEDRT